VVSLRADAATPGPLTGADVQDILGYHALMLRAGQTLRLPVRSPAMVFHLIEGSARLRIQQQGFRWPRPTHAARPVARQ
jgi:gentisate 1,2-dioxygenase